MLLEWADGDALDTCKELERKLRRPFTGIYIYITGTKLASDPVVGASVTGHVGCKAQLVKQIGACVYIDDQQQLLNEAAEAQANRAYKPTHKLT